MEEEVEGGVEKEEKEEEWKRYTTHEKDEKSIWKVDK